METPGQVFISYCSPDSEEAQRVCQVLEERGIACWIALRNIPPGREWSVAISEAIKRSSSFVLLLSSNSHASRQIGREVDVADRSGIRIFTFRLEEVNPPAQLEYFLSNLQWVDGFDDRFDSGIETLERGLRSASPQVAVGIEQPRQTRRSPNRQLAVSVLIAFGLALAMQTLEYYGWFAGPDGRILDGVLTGRSRMVDDLDKAVVVLEIDNDAFLDRNCFNGESPLKPAMVKDLVKATLASRPGPRVVGVDIFTPADEYRDFKFQAGEASVIWTSGVESDSSIEAASLPRWLLGAHDHVVVRPSKVLGRDYRELAERRDVRWGVPAFPADDDSTLRRFTRQVEILQDSTSSQKRVTFPGWAVQVMQAYCSLGATCGSLEGDELYVTYEKPPPDQLKLLDYFSCDAGLELKLRPERAKDFEKQVSNKAVLIGGTFRQPGESGDYHVTAIGTLPGLLINAYAVRAAISGSGLHDVQQPWALLLDFAIGLLIVLIFHRPLFRRVTRAKRIAWLRGYEVRCLIGASVLVLLTFYFLIRWWPGAAYLKGFTGVCLGVLLHQVIHLFLDNPRRLS